MQDLSLFLSPDHYLEYAPVRFNNMQLGSFVSYEQSKSFDWPDADIVILGCQLNKDAHAANGPDSIRASLYEMYQWHPSVRIYDAGNIMMGATQADTRAALLAVLEEVEAAGKIAIVLGDEHSLTCQQIGVFKKRMKPVSLAVADMLVDLDDANENYEHAFLLDMLTGYPNYISHYVHLGFQSYYVHPRMLETLDRLRFDFVRLGRLRERIEEAEPLLRDAAIFSCDLLCVRYPDAIANAGGSPNGFTGEEACSLARYAGMSHALRSFGIYGYNYNMDKKDMTAKLIAQMIWYFLDGYVIRRAEADLTNEQAFVKFHIATNEFETYFLKSKRTGRWWMQVSSGRLIPCLYQDYLTASQSEIPERWLREHEKLS